MSVDQIAVLVGSLASVALVVIEFFDHYEIVRRDRKK